MRGWPFRCAAPFVLALAGVACTGQVNAMTFTGAAPVALVYSASSLAEDDIPMPSSADVPTAADLPAPARAAARRTLGGLLLELPPEITPGMPAQRPRYILGLRSDEVRTWLNGMGVPARQCYAPMVRANTKISSDGLRGTLWLYARCAFD